MTDMLKRVSGQGKRLFAEAQASPDDTSFKIENTSMAYYDSPYYKKHKEDVQEVPPPRVSPPRLDLADVLGRELLQPIIAELYPEVVDAREEEGGVPSRLTKTDRREAGKEGTPCQMFAGSPSGRATMRSGSRWTTSRGRARGG
jgi:hypothetical protein